MIFDLFWHYSNDSGTAFIIFHVKLVIPLIVTAISEMFWERNCRANAMSNFTV